MGSLDNRQVIVTGGTGALGTAVVDALLKGGAICHVPCVKEDELKHFPFAKHDRVRLSMNVELTDESAVEKLYGSVRGDLWASINIAGGFAYAPIDTMTRTEFVAQMQMNILTCFLCCREAVKRMGSGGGRIVNVAARPAIEPRIGANMTAYTAAKCAVAGFTQALAEEVAGRGVLVNAVAPSIMDTPANRVSMPKADFARWPKVEQVASTIVFLASPENTVTRGGIVPVYGQS